MARIPAKLPRGISFFRPLDPGKAPRYRLRIMFKGKQYSAGIYETLADAKEAQKRYKKQADLGTFVPAREKHRRWREEREEEEAQKEAERAEQERRSVTVSDYATTWLWDLSQGNDARKESTIRSYSSTLNAHILPNVGHVYLADIGQEIVDKLIRSVEASSGLGAGRNVAHVLRVMFNAAASEGAGTLDKVPFKVKITKPDPKTADEVPTPAEVESIAAHMPPQTALLPVLAGLCALRPSETLGLQRRDLMDLDKPTARLTVARQWVQKQKPPGYGPPKYDSIRSVGIPQFLIPKIKDHLNQYVGPEPEAPLFASPQNPQKPLSPTATREQWKAAIKAAGVRPFVLHSLRHLGLTLTAVAGGTGAEVMARGGHKNAEAAARYQHPLRGREQQLTEAMGAYWEGING